MSTVADNLLTTEARADVLAQAVAQEAHQGWRVQSQTSTTAQLVKGKPTNHILHLILSILTLGIWLVVWLLMVVLAGEKHRLLSVGPDGRVTRS